MTLRSYGNNFFLTFCIALIIYYLLASILSWLAYREFKGVAEDIAGGSVTMTTFGNILHYAIIDKREEDAIDDRAAKKTRLEELKKQEEERAAAGNDEEEGEGDGGGEGQDAEGGEADALLQ